VLEQWGSSLLQCQVDRTHAQTGYRIVSATVLSLALSPACARSGPISQPLQNRSPRIPFAV